MARHTFGGDVASIAVTVDTDKRMSAANGATVTFANAQSGGTAVTDLLAADGVTPITSVTTAADGTLPAFYGPDGTTQLWAIVPGAASRRLILATDFVSSANATYISNTGVPGLRRTLTSVGTSILANGAGIYTSGANTNVYNPKSPILWAMLLSGGRFLDIGTAAVAGNTSAQVLANQIPVVLAMSPKPDYCVIQTGTNDGGLDKTSIDGIVSALLNAAITPILTTIPPQVSVANSHIDVNQYIIRKARTMNLPLVDFHYALVDPSTGNYLSGYDAGDGVHPSEIGAKAMGQALSDTLTKVLGVAQPLGLLTENANPSAAFANACFLTVHASTQPYPPWLVSAGSGWTNTYTTPSWVKGQLFTLTRGSTDAIETSDSSNDATITDGHRYLIGFKVTTSIKGVGGGAVFRMTRRSDSYQAFDIGTFAEDIPVGSVFVCEWVCPTGKGGAYVPEIRALTASGAAVSIAQYTVLDLTTLIGA